MSDSQANLIDLSHRAVEAIDRLNEKLAYLEVEVVVQENTAETWTNEYRTRSSISPWWAVCWPY